MKKLQLEGMEVVVAGGWGKCAAGALGGYTLGALGGIEAGGYIAGVLALANPVGAMVGLAVAGGVILGIGGAIAACK